MTPFSGKTLMITGGTGSFGEAVLKRFLDTDIGEIRIFSRDEKKQDDMRHHYQNDKIKYYIGDVRELSSVKNAIHGVDYLFHAAALKQVPSCEFFPIEAVKTNVLGADNVLTACIEEGVRKVICLSTDKAAYPVNAMGTSKAMMEKVFVAKARTVSPERTLICGTRYGNVMCSRGSVIPLFIEQIRSGQPITVTSPDMTRFIMSLEEAVELAAAYRAEGLSLKDAVRRAAEERARQLIDEQEIVRISQAKSSELIANAESRSRELRRVATEYVDDALRRSEEAMSSALAELRNARSSFKSAAGPVQQPRPGTQQGAGAQTQER